jgi:hypothetical protein
MMMMIIIIPQREHGYSSLENVVCFTSRDLGDGPILRLENPY